MSTLNTLGVVATLVALVTISGLPAAILVDRRRPLRVAQTLALAQFLGLGIVLVVVLGLVHFGMFTVPWLMTAIIIVTAGLTVGAVRSTPQIRPPRFTLAGGVTAIIIGAAALLRTDPIYFIYETADFGEYVNRANRIAAGDPFGEWLLNLFPAALSVPGLIFGSIHTTDLMPVLGLLLIVGIAAISDRLAFSPWITATVTFVSAFHILPVWYSELPASETLFAVLLVGMVLLLVTAVVEAATAGAVIAGGFGFLLAIGRANAVLLAPVVVAAAIISIVALDKRSARTTIGFIASFFVASSAGFFYDLTFNSPYFVDHQLGLFFPSSVLEAVALLSNPFVAVVVTATGGLFLWGLVHAARWIARRAAFARRLSTVLPLSLLAGLALFIGLRALSGDYASPGGKILVLGPLLFVLTIAGILLGAFDRSTDHPERRSVYWIATFVVIAFTALQAVRVDLPDNDVAPYFLYWQRYYLSEIFPLALLLSLLSLERLTDAVVRFVPGERVRRLAAVAVAVVMMAIVGIEAIAPNLAIASGSMFDTSYESIADLDRMTSEPEDALIIYLGSGDLPEGWFWPNTSRLVALPLSETFGRDVIGLRSPREPDLRLSGDELANLLDTKEPDRIYLITDYFEQPDTDALASRGWDAHLIGSVEVTIVRLPWDADTRAEDQRYVTTTLDLDVYEMNRQVTK